jgi:SAM-dependent methyltransferase
MPHPPIDLTQVRRSFASGKSLWRALMNAHVATIQLEQPVLDLGAGAKGTASYHSLIPQFDALEVSSVDIDGSKNPTKIADIEQGIPFENDTFRACLAFNLFEHLYEYDSVLHKVWFALAAGGTLYLAVPFLMRVHADPSDYFRYTTYSLERMLSRAGFSDIVITPCGTGALGAALSQVDFMVPGFLRGLAFRIALAGDKLITRRSGGKYRNANDYPLGYFVTAKKPDAA